MFPPSIVVFLLSASLVASLSLTVDYLRNASLHATFSSALAGQDSTLFIENNKEYTRHLADVENELPSSGTAGHSADSAGQATHQLRCAMTLGTWCQSYHHQEFIPVQPAPQGDKECKNSCNKRGNCNYDTGICDCAAGWAGDDCSDPQLRPCTTGYRSSGKEPRSHVGPDGRDKDVLATGWQASRCAGWCDVTTAACYCPPGSKYGHIPAPKGSPIGTPPIQQGKAMLDCKVGTDEKGQTSGWGRGFPPWEDVFGPKGYCETEGNNVGCGCTVDGMLECGMKLVERWCPNQCSAHGTCMSGWCVCHEGWYGHDCARPRKGMAFGPGLLEQHRWLKPLVRPPLETQTKPTVTKRKRPLIYVYDTPNIFNTRLKQYALLPLSCTWRHTLNHLNHSGILDTVYALEQLMHELMLRSNHRTFDPEQADYFYVPTYLSCFSWPVMGWADFPWFHAPQANNRVSHFTGLINTVKESIATLYPFWNRRGGRDHIFFMPNDEGACAAPNTAWPAIFFVHWGRTDLNHSSGTAYFPDNYTSVDVVHPEFQPNGYQYLLKGKPCFDPLKDLVIPPFKSPSSYMFSPFLDGPSKPLPQRDILLFFRGDVGDQRMPQYSRRIRQKLANLSRGGWNKQYKILVGSRSDIPGTYSDLIRRSKFCLTAPGDGWSARFEDSVLHGCVPLIIKDNVQETFESILQVQQYSVRVREADIELIPQLLTSIPEIKLAAMQENLKSVWHRYVYADHPLIRGMLQSIVMRRGGDTEYAKNLYSSIRNNDAFQTILQWLYSMIPLTR